MKSLASSQVLYVNEAEQKQRSCRKLLRQTAGRWELAPAGTELLNLLLY
ncbi:MAG: hypothetical protein HYR88_13255 [Verrucomicrobia bacterium]|nr:hypothetical protein [Verrucomicrobiota bacterium]